MIFAMCLAYIVQGTWLDTHDSQFSISNISLSYRCTAKWLFIVIFELLGTQVCPLKAITMGNAKKKT